MRTVLIDYGSGNLRSAAKAFEKAAGGPASSIIVSNDPRSLKDATHIVLPGVGAFADCMRGLTALPGMLDALEEAVIEKKKPFLGICVGMQLMLQKGFEHGEHKGLGWIEGDVVKIAAASPLKIPHMGWNELAHSQHPLFKGIAPADHAYFVHSYHARCKNASDIIATTHYGTPLTAAIAKDNRMGVQFHPEKSQATGLRIIENFLRF